MRALLRRAGALDAAAAGYAAAYFAWLVAHALGLFSPAFGRVAFYPAGLVVAWANWQNSRVPGLDGRTRTAWRLLAVAALALWGTGSVWTFWITAVNAREYPAWIDLAVLGPDFASLAAYVWLPGRRPPRESRKRFFLDVSLVVMAGFVFVFYFGLRPFFLGATGTATSVIFDASVDWALLAAAGVGYIQKRDPEIRTALLVLLGANLAYLSANSVMAALPSYQTGDMVDGLWFLAWGLRFVAARTAWHRYQAGGRRGGAAADDGAYRSSRLSYAMVAGAFALLLSRVVAGGDELLGPIAVAAMAMGALLVLRQFAELEENARLFAVQIEDESRFQALVQNSSDAVLVVDDRGLLTYVSPSAGRVFGGGVAIEPGMAFRQALPGDEGETAGALLGAGRREDRRFEVRVPSAPGRWREIEGIWTDLRDDPAVRGVVVNCRDVTARHEAEQNLQQAQKIEAVGHLAGGLAHDLNNLLTVIRGYAELLRSEWPADAPGVADLDRIIEAVDRAAHATGKILAFSRRRPVSRRPIDLNAVIADAQPMLLHLTTSAVSLRLRLAPALWRVVADQGQMEQVIVNLVTNASDAMPDGGVVEIATGNRAIATPTPAMGSLPPGDYVALTVSDQGTGMSPEVAARAFEPFYSTKPSGLGLGLAIVRGVVTESDGGVLVDSAEGRGSTVIVLLPRAGSE